ncbi:MAG: hypothetical protein AB8B51_19345 [Sedimentitalea sp.]
MNPVEIRQGDHPIVSGLPQTGTYGPDAIFADLNPRGRGFDDTAAPWAYDPAKSEQLREHLTSILTRLAELARP